MSDQQPKPDLPRSKLLPPRLPPNISATASQASIETSRTGAISSDTPRSDAPEPAAPRQFGRYRIEKELGKGAMGVVYLAEDTQLGRKVALKIPKKSVLEETDALERFYREARTAATLRHTNICPMFDVGEIDGTHFLTMAYIPGKPISSFLGKGKLPAARQVALLVRKIALALDEAHRQGVIHRDLKPSNVILDDRGEPIVMDFGLARQMNTPDNARITQSGAILGTPAYMSPEQVQGDLDKIGPRCDVYALGVILYQLLSGELPFNGPIMMVFAQIVTQEPPPLSDLRPDVDPTLAAICRKMMAKESSQRYSGMKGVAQALTEFLQSQSRESGEASQSTRPTPDIERSQQTAKGLLDPVTSASQSFFGGRFSNRRLLLTGGGLLSAILLFGIVVMIRHKDGAEERIATDGNSLSIESKDGSLKILVSNSESAVPNAARIDAPARLFPQGAVYVGTWRNYEAANDEPGNATDLTVTVMDRDGENCTSQWRMHDWNTLWLTKGRVSEHESGGTVTIDDVDLVDGDHPNEGNTTLVLNFQEGGVKFSGSAFYKSGGRSEFDARLVSAANGETDAPRNVPPLAVAPFDANQARAHQEAWAKQFGVPVEFTNSMGMQFVLIPPGEFLMGATARETKDLIADHPFVKANQWAIDLLRREVPQRQAILNDPYYIGVHEVTRGQFRRFVESSGYQTNAERNGGGKDWVEETKQSEQRPEFTWKRTEQTPTDNFPVRFLALEDAQQFVKWLCETEHGNYAVPTEAQWEFACRAGTDAKWHFGDDESAAATFGWLSIAGNHSAMHSVGRKEANPFGLRDVLGNVAELAVDENQAAFLRGGSTISHPVVARSASRFAAETIPEFTYGLRVVITGDLRQAVHPGEQPRAELPLSDQPADPKSPELAESLLNPDFADGFVGWTQEGGADGFHLFRMNGQPAMSTFGKRKEKDTGRLYQQFRVPIDATELEFFVHGGEHPALSISLREDEQTLRRATGKNSNSPFNVRWDLRELRGKAVTLNIVDTHTGHWGFIGIHGLHLVREGDPVISEAESSPRLVYPVNGDEDLVWNLARDTGWKKGPDRHGVWKTGTARMNPASPQQLLIEPTGSEIACETLSDDIYTDERFGDVRVELEFLIPQGSNSGVFLMGEYEININDSDRSGHINHGPNPAVVARKPAGEWQYFDITFRAPRFNADGEKIEDAVLEKVNFNGAVIHTNVVLKGPTNDPSMLTGKESATGPLLLQGSLGPVAFRNIRITPLDEPQDEAVTPPLTQDMVPDADGWITLFDGKSRQGWKHYGLAGQGSYQPVNGVLKKAGKKVDRGFLAHQQEFTDFVLQLDYRLNSIDDILKIFFRLHPQGNRPPTNTLAVQLIDNRSDKQGAKGDKKRAPEKSNGALFDLAGPQRIVNLPFGEWHSLEVRAVGPKITVKIDRKVVLDVNLKQIKGLPRDSEAFNVEGAIGIQNFNGQSELRNIRIQPLNEKGQPAEQP